MMKFADASSRLGQKVRGKKGVARRGKEEEVERVGKRRKKRP